MNIYRARVGSGEKNAIGQSWMIGVLTEEEQALYYECETSEDYNNLVRGLTGEEYDDDGVDFYVAESEVDLANNRIVSGIYSFIDLKKVL